MADYLPGPKVSARWMDEKPSDIFDDPAKIKAEPMKKHRLETGEMLSLHRSMQAQFAAELNKQSAWRVEMERDEAVYDNDHWAPQEAAALEDRGQIPLVFNVTATAVNWVLGSERRTPMDYKILPRQKGGLRHAEHKSALLKYLSDVNDAPMNASRAFAEQVKAGLGWLECGVQAEDDGEPIYERYESWRNIIWDSSAAEWDLSDARYIFRVKWVDGDRACAMFPDRRHVIADSTRPVYDTWGYDGIETGDSAMDSREDNNNWTGASNWGTGIMSSNRTRVKMYECWFRRPVQSQYVSGGEFSGDLWDTTSTGQVRDVMMGRAEVVTKVKERMFVAIFVDRGLVHLSPSPYRHNNFPFTPLWGYRRAKDGAPYGMIRNIRDIQLDLNKRAAKSLWHLTAQRAMVAKGSIGDIEDFREEMGRPDAILEYDETKPPPSITNDLQHAAAQADYMSRDIQMIQSISGVTDENMGRTTNAVSGKAINARQEQGQLTTNIFFEHLRFARKKHGEKMLALVEQYMRKERQFRITDERGLPDWITINATDPATGEPVDDSQITATKADFIVSEIDYRATHRQANLDLFMQFVGGLANTDGRIIPAILDLLIEMMDLPKRDELVKRVRQITGQMDPDADPDNPTPEMMEMKAQKDAAADMQARMANAEIAGKEAEAEYKQAQARKMMADILAKTPELAGREMDNMAKALQVIIDTAGMEATAAAADRLMQQANAAAANAIAPAIQPPQPPMPQPAAQMGMMPA